MSGRTIHVEEFLWRGRPEGDGRAPAWHVVLMETGGVDGFGQPLPPSTLGPLTPEQATALGWTLPDIVADIDAAAIDAAAALVEENRALRATCESLAADVAELEKRVAELSSAAAPSAAGGG